jgi:hypothetical protein
VDLAGTERADKTCAEGPLRKEGVNINRSLLTLSIVIRSLSGSAAQAGADQKQACLCHDMRINPSLTYLQRILNDSLWHYKNSTGSVLGHALVFPAWISVATVPTA